MAMTLQARLARLEALESAQRFPTTLEFHRVVSVRSNDHRRGSCEVQGNEVTFYASSAAEYEEASARQAAGRNIILIMVDARCIDFQQEGGAQ